MKDTATLDTLLILAPPSRLVRWLEQVVAAKGKKGEVIPPEIERWLTRWQKIRQGLTTEIDVLTDDEWQAIGVFIDRVIPDDQR